MLSFLSLTQPRTQPSQWAQRRAMDVGFGRSADGCYEGVLNYFKKIYSTPWILHWYPQQGNWAGLIEQAQLVPIVVAYYITLNYIQEEFLELIRCIKKIYNPLCESFICVWINYLNHDHYSFTIIEIKVSPLAAVSEKKWK